MNDKSALAPREREVLELLADGYSYEQAGMLLGVSLASVRTYVRRLYGKLGVHTKSEATMVALRMGAISLNAPRTYGSSAGGAPKSALSSERVAHERRA